MKPEESCDRSPPIPAPYLAGVPTLPPHLALGGNLALPDSVLDRSPSMRLALQARVRDLCKIIIRRRKQYEQANGGIVIKEEDPLAE